MSRPVSLQYSTAGVTADKRLLFFLVGVFLVLAPASVSDATTGGTSYLKWGRVGILGATLLVGIRWFRLPRFADLSGKLLLMSVVFCLASLWSTAPLWGLMYKGMFVGGVCASISLAHCLRTESDFRVLSRTMTFATWFSIALLAYLIFGAGDYEIWKGRLVVAGMNANTLGLSAAVFALLCLFHLMIRDSGAWRFLAVVGIGVMSVLIVYSGSRAAVLTLVSGVALLIPALAKTRKNAVVLGVLSVTSVTALGIIWFGLTDDTRVDAFGATVTQDSKDSLRILEELTKDTRMNVWKAVTTRWVRDDLAIGAGWLHRAKRWQLVQSAYLQVVVEAGLIGLVCVLVFLYGGAEQVLRAMRQARRTQGLTSLMLYLFSATFFAVAFHGVFESAAVVGTTPNAILLGFSAAQLDIQLRTASSDVRMVHPVKLAPQIPRMTTRPRP